MYTIAHIYRFVVHQQIQEREKRHAMREKRRTINVQELRARKLRSSTIGRFHAKQSTRLNAQWCKDANERSQPRRTRLK